MYVFRAASAADVVATITVKAGATALGATANFKYGGTTINAAAAVVDGTLGTTTFPFIVTATDAMRFETSTSTAKIQRVYLVYGAITYQVLVDVNGVISFKNGTNPSIQVGDTDYAAMKARYDFFMGALGFSWDGTAKYMNAALILKNLIPGATGTVGVTFPAGYQSIVDPSVQPPQTGDATTVVGFVMIALALVAAAVVTVKKVRA
jgi:LPXTG-motif cell wall-anchored protein